MQCHVQAGPCKPCRGLYLELAHHLLAAEYAEAHVVCVFQTKAPLMGQPSSDERRVTRCSPDDVAQDHANVGGAGIQETGHRESDLIERGHRAAANDWQQRCPHGQWWVRLPQQRRRQQHREHLPPHYHNLIRCALLPGKLAMVLHIAAADIQCSHRLCRFHNMRKTDGHGTKSHARSHMPAHIYRMASKVLLS